MNDINYQTFGSLTKDVVKKLLLRDSIQRKNKSWKFAATMFAEMPI